MPDWDGLEAACGACRVCSLGEARTNVVFGEGSKTAPILFVGEGPGEQEDLTGRPFVGRAGKLLDDMLGAVDLSRETVYIANMVKCRPPGNRDPLGVEIDACIGWLRNQVALLRPRIIVCVGRIAAMRLIDPNIKISQDHGKWYLKNGVHMTAVFHPAALLRDPRRRPETFLDMKAIAAKLAQLTAQHD